MESIGGLRHLSNSHTAIKTTDDNMSNEGDVQCVFNRVSQGFCGWGGDCFSEEMTAGLSCEG